MEIQMIIHILENNKIIFNLLKSCPYEILRQWKTTEYESGATIFCQGEKEHHFNLIASGTVDISVTGENGKSYSQATYHTGDMIGELEIFNDVPYLSTVKAITDVTIISLPREYFLQWLQVDIEFNQRFMRQVVHLFYSIVKKEGDNTLYSLRSRVCAYLKDAGNTGKKRAEGIEVYVNKQELSQLFAVTQRSINRILSELKDKGIISLNKQRVIIKDYEKLAAYLK
ncbi:Crp/Fnr family transcriptional regulator [Bacillus sp. 1P06AnD]|uniref:Crp/Fnr family transcriptional regulator n=1 Tax=Bacillus sp. 1P06AnD TaxID=3132208 RepID=UPI0039A30291